MARRFELSSTRRAVPSSVLGGVFWPRRERPANARRVRTRRTARVAGFSLVEVVVALALLAAGLLATLDLMRASTAFTGLTETDLVARNLVFDVLERLDDVMPGALPFPGGSTPTGPLTYDQLLAIDPVLSHAFPHAELAPLLSRARVTIQIDRPDPLTAPGVARDRALWVDTVTVRWLDSKLHAKEFSIGRLHR